MFNVALSVFSIFVINLAFPILNLYNCIVETAQHIIQDILNRPQLNMEKLDNGEEFFLES